MGRSRTGSVEWLQVRWGARIRMLDGTRPVVLLSAELRRDQEKEAREEAVALQEAASRGESVKGEVPTLGAFAKKWIDARIRKGFPSAYDDRGRWNKHVPERLDAIRLDHISHRNLDPLVTYLNERMHAGKMSTLTAKHVWTLVKRVLKEAKAAGHMRDIPTARVALDQPKLRKDLQWLWPKEAAKLLACVDIPPERRRVWALLLYTGVRVGELEAMCVGDYDPENGVLNVKRGVSRRTKKRPGTKTGGARSFRVEPAIRPLLDSLCRNRATHTKVIVIPGRVEHLAPRLRRDARMAGVRVAQADDVTKALRAHDLRASAITWWLARGDKPLAVRDRAGHTTLAMTERYYRSAVSDANLSPDVFFPPLVTDIWTGLCMEPPSVRTGGNVKLGKTPREVGGGLSPAHLSITDFESAASAIPPLRLESTKPDNRVPTCSPVETAASAQPVEVGTGMDAAPVQSHPLAVEIAQQVQAAMKSGDLDLAQRLLAALKALRG